MSHPMSKQASASSQDKLCRMAGGKVKLTAGAESGPGRLLKAEAQREDGVRGELGSSPKPRADRAGRAKGGKVKRADGGRLENTSSFHKGVDYSDPAQDENYHNEGSRGALKEALYEQGLAEPGRNLGQGPTKANAKR